jgi:hypothetical protein
VTPSPSVLWTKLNLVPATVERTSTSLPGPEALGKFLVVGKWMGFVTGFVVAVSIELFCDASFKALIMDSGVRVLFEEVFEFVLFDAGDVSFLL